MYGLLTLFCILFFYLTLKKYLEKSFQYKNGLLISVTVLGFLTQYFFLFFCIVLFLLIISFLAYEKDFRNLFYYIISMIIAGVLGVLLFPFAISDILFSGRGVEAIGNLGTGIAADM